MRATVALSRSTCSRRALTDSSAARSCADPLTLMKERVLRATQAEADEEVTDLDDVDDLAVFGADEPDELAPPPPHSSTSPPPTTTLRPPSSPPPPPSAPPPPAAPRTPPSPSCRTTPAPSPPRRLPHPALRLEHALGRVARRRRARGARARAALRRACAAADRGAGEANGRGGARAGAGAGGRRGGRGRRRRGGDGLWEREQRRRVGVRASMGSCPCSARCSAARRSRMRRGGSSRVEAD